MKLSRMISNVKLKSLKKRGLTVGKNFTMENRVRIDNGFPWLVEIGDNVTLAPEVMILSHDACTKKILGFGTLGKVIIGNNVFIGARSIVLSNTRIGNNCIIGAGSVVTKDIPDNSIACGNPARVIKTMEEFTKNKIEAYNNGIVIKKSIIKTARKDIIKQKELKEYMKDERLYIGSINENKK